MMMGERKALLLVVVVAVWTVVPLQETGAVVRRGGDAASQEQGPAIQEFLTEALTEVLNATLRRRAICPPPYYAVLDECFYVHQFVPLLSWEDARAFCRSAGGDLARPQHYGALIAYLYEFKKVAQTVFDLYEYELWMGGRLQEGEEVRWVSGEVVPRDAFTGEEEPQCMVLIISRVDPPALVTAPCSQTKHFACQLQL